MSNENVEIAHRAMTAYNREGISGILPYLDPEVEWANPVDSPVAGVWVGHEGVLEWQRLTDEVFEEMHFEPKRIDALPDGQVLVISDFRLKGRALDIEMELPFAHLISFRDGKATKVRMYTSEAAALEAAGLSGSS
jgi:ketosteroid isomerase-like protein